jgi:uncharacterized membrane protein
LVYDSRALDVKMMFASEAHPEFFLGNALSAMALGAALLMIAMHLGSGLLLRTAGVIITPLLWPRLLLWTGCFRVLTVLRLAGIMTRVIAAVFTWSSGFVVLLGLSSIFVFLLVLVFRFLVLLVIRPVGALLRKSRRPGQQKQKQQYGSDGGENSHVILR